MFPQQQTCSWYYLPQSLSKIQHQNKHRHCKQTVPSPTLHMPSTTTVEHFLHMLYKNIPFTRICLKLCYLNTLLNSDMCQKMGNNITLNVFYSNSANTKIQLKQTHTTMNGRMMTLVFASV